MDHITSDHIPSGHIIRTAGRADLPAIIGLLVDDPLGSTRDTVNDVLDPAYEAAFAAIEQDPNHRIVVMQQGDRIVGCMQISYLPGLSRKGMWRGQIESVRIARPLRGQGLGRAFFLWAIADCKARGCGLVQLATDASRAEAHKFYLRLGFEPSHVGMKLKL